MPHPPGALPGAEAAPPRAARTDRHASRTRLSRARRRERGVPTPSQARPHTDRRAPSVDAPAGAPGATQGPAAHAQEERGGGLRPVHALTRADLERCPVWEFRGAGEGGPEAWDEGLVRPRADLGGPLPRSGALVVHTRFTAADGTRYDGYCTPVPSAAAPGHPGALHPVIVHARGQVDFWLGSVRLRRAELLERYRALDTTPERLFPLTFEVLVPVPGLVGAGVLRGFEARWGVEDGARARGS